MRNQKTDYIMMIVAMLIYGTIGIFRRYIPLSSAMLACARGFIGSVGLFIFIKLCGRKFRHGIARKSLILLMISGAVMGFNWMTLFEAYNYTSVSIATLCYYMQPTILILASPLVFRETISAKKMLCVIISLIGMVMVSGLLEGGAIGKSDIKGIVLGLMSALMYAIVVVLNKKVQVEDAYEKTIIQLFFAAIVLVPYILVTEDVSSVSLTTTSIILVVILGLVHTGLAFALYFASMQGLSTQSIAILAYIDPVSALILSALILNEKMTVFGVIGAVLIIGTALLSEINIHPKKAAEPTAE